MAANVTTTVNGNISAGYLLKDPKSQKKATYGLLYPLGANPKRGYFSKATGIELIKSAVKQLLLTSKGERVMLPNYGCNLRQYLFQPLDQVTFEQIKKDIQTSFRNYIKGPILTKLTVFPTGDAGPAGGNSLQIILSLKLDSSELETFDVEVELS